MLLCSAPSYVARCLVVWYIYLLIVVECLLGCGCVCCFGVFFVIICFYSLVVIAIDLVFVWIGCVGWLLLGCYLFNSVADFFGL